MGNQQSKNLMEPESVVLNNRNLTKFPFTPSKESKIKYLYLSGNHISSLPKNMKEVILVDISSNEIGPSLPISISEALASYPKLNTLYLTQNNLEDVNNLQNSTLQTFYLAQNRLNQLPNQFFGKFPDIQTIFLDCNFIKVLSNQKSESIHTLSSSLNCIETIDTSTLAFSQLISLDLSKNRITKLPDSFSKSFPNLQTLNLSNNFISEIPENKGDDLVLPEKLTEINLSNNLLEKVPNSITNIPNLTKLNLDNNKISHIPQLNSKIVEFRAANNKISSIDDQKLDFLKEFVIFKNEIEEFPIQIKSSQNNSFIIDHNKISGFHFDDISINDILSTHITVIDISFNQIESIPKELFESLPNLHTFSAIFNKITVIPSEISNCQNLFYLNVSHNPIKKLPQLPNSLNRITASNCQIESFSENQPPNLKLIDLSGNNLTSFPTIPTIQILNLSQNRIKKMPDVTDCMRVLDLSMNEIDSTPDFINGPSIADINLSHNKLTKLPQSLNAPFLHYLELSENPIEAVLDVSKFPFLKRIDITQTGIEIAGSTAKIEEIITSRREEPKEEGKRKKEEGTATPKIIYVNQEIDGNKRKSGYSEFLGMRNSMEDSIIVRDDLNLYAVCDGHGGASTAKLASIVIADQFEERRNDFLLEKAFDFVSQMVRESIEKILRMGLNDGSTLCLAFLVTNENNEKKLITAHLGDSRAMIVRSDGQSRELTKDHKPSMRSEFERVHNEFGVVSKDDRIDGVLAVARSIGDLNVQGVGREAELNEFDVDKDDRFLVIGCDGVFDVLQNDDVAKIASEASSPDEAAYMIRNAAFACLSNDNISVVVVDLN
ncbi:hypothetical protein M9Y10_007778 [Tritrichomonas musculus]|uniref:PPM-type phosphatase domain-containing protein n=1 Tax=Tritrichomonas musculus TaxID=1915356 RepID=A0ABR2J2A0_9EUKA